MNPSRPAWRAALVGVALSVVCVLLLAPPTGWLARAQFAAVGFHLPQSDEQSQATEADRHERAARQFPKDVDVQIAAALDRAKVRIKETMHVGFYSPYFGTAQTDALQELAPRFPDSPVMYATLLRYRTMGNNYYCIYIARRHEEILLDPAPSLSDMPSQAKSRSGASSITLFPNFRPPPAILAAWDTDCATGERLDPTNAYFPMMRAIGLFGAYRDADAVKAVLRAGKKPLWNDYAQDEMQGYLRMADSDHKEENAFRRAVIAASTPFPHLSALRSVTRLATVKAMQREQAGNVEGGLAIRRALMNVGDRMRVQSPTEVGSLGGISIAAIAESRPGGAPVFTGSKPAELTDMQIRSWLDTRRTEPFAAYAVQHGHPEVADIARAQATAGKAVSFLNSQAEQKTFYSKLTPHAALWNAGELLLAVAFWLLLPGGAARLLTRRTAFREVRPLPFATRWGITAAVLLMTISVIYNFFSAMYNIHYSAEVGINVMAACYTVTIVGLGAVFLLRRRITRRGIARFAWAFVVTACILAGSACIFFRQAHGIGETWQDVGGLRNLSGSNDSFTLIGTDFFSTLLLGMVTSALPVLMLFVFAIWGRVRCVPVSVAVVRGFLSASVPVACVLLLVWGGLCLVTVRQERQLNAELDRMTTHEGRYYASLAGAPWPGPAVPE